MTGPLSHSPATIVSQLLVDGGICGLPPTSLIWPAYVTSLPDTPDDAVVVTDTESVQEGRVQFTGEIQEHYGVQIKIRSGKYSDGYAVCEEIKELLDLLVYNESVFLSEGPTAATYTVHAITRTTGIVVIGKEVSGSKRSLFTINALVSVTKN